MMNHLLTGLIAINGFILAVWLIRIVVLAIAGLILKPLRADMYPNDDGELPAVSMLVAAKEEAANIESCIRSIDAQDYPNLQIIAVNDRSDDDTGAILDRLATEHTRLTVRHVTQLRDGWFGKNNAMREGVEAADGEWLCFTDADCVQTSTRSLRIAMRYALEKGADFLSVLPSHKVESFWERTVQPACSAVMILWFSPLIVNNPRRKTAYANGAFMLMKRACYDAIGGHDRVRDQINEDMHMARIAKAGGQRLIVVGNHDLYNVRMYGTLRQIWRGWTRIFCGSFTSLLQLWIAAGFVAFFTFLPWLSLAFAAAADGLSHERGDIETLKYTALGACAAQLITMGIFYTISRVGFLYGLTYPIGALLSLGTLLNAIRCASGFGDIKWRGTTYRDGAITPETNAA